MRNVDLQCLGAPGTSLFWLCLWSGYRGLLQLYSRVRWRCVDPRNWSKRLSTHRRTTEWTASCCRQAPDRTSCPRRSSARSPPRTSPAPRSTVDSRGPCDHLKTRQTVFNRTRNVQLYILGIFLDEELLAELFLTELFCIFNAFRLQHTRYIVRYFTTLPRVSTFSTDDRDQTD